MKNVFFTNLCWKNCKSYPPEELIGDIMLTNGTAVYEGFHTISLVGTPKWYILSINDAPYKKIRQEDLGNWWWADVVKHIRKEFE